MVDPNKCGPFVDFWKKMEVFFDKSLGLLFDCLEVRGSFMNHGW